MDRYTQSTARFLTSLYSPARRKGVYRPEEFTSVGEWAVESRKKLREIVRLTAMTQSLAGFTPVVNLEQRSEEAEYLRYYGTMSTEPEVTIPFWYLVPKTPGPHPLAIFPHGHYAEHGYIHHYDCNAIPGIADFGEFWDIAALVAPRKLLAVYGKSDPLFPANEVQRTVAETRRVFDLIDAPGCFSHEVGAGGHRFYSELMWPFVMGSFGDISRS